MKSSNSWVRLLSFALVIFSAATVQADEADPNGPPLDPIEAPELWSPVAVDVAENRPTLRIGNVEDPADRPLRYGFFVYRDGEGEALVAASGLLPAGDGSTTWRAPLLPEGVPLYWTARAHDGERFGPAADRGRFSIEARANAAPGAPRVVGPVDGALVASRAVSLVAADAVDPEGQPLSYVFMLSDDPSFPEADTRVSPHIEPIEGEASWRIPGEMVDGKTWFWRVHAHDGVHAGPMAEASFRIDLRTPVPELWTPSGGEPVDEAAPALVALGRRAHLGRELSYAFEVFADAGLNRRVARSPLVSPNVDGVALWSVPAGTLAEDQRYWWTARAHDGSAYTAFATPTHFAVDAEAVAPDAPRVSSPAPGDEVTRRRPRVELEAAFDPDPNDRLRYECQIAADPQFDEVVAMARRERGQVRPTTLRANADLDDHGRYFLRCRATDARRMTGDWSDTVPFAVNTANDAPGAPTPLFPVAGERVEDRRVVLVARAPHDLDGDRLSFQFRLSDHPDFPAARTFESAALEAVPGTDVVRWTPREPLADNATWYWQLRAHDGMASGPWAQSRFRVDTFNDLPTTPRGLEPAHGSVAAAQPRFVWGAASDIDEEGSLRYEIELHTGDGERVWSVVTKALFHDLPGRLRAGEFVWRVRAIDGVGEASAWSDAMVFEVERDGEDEGPDAEAEIEDPTLEPIDRPDGEREDGPERPMRDPGMADVAGGAPEGVEDVMVPELGAPASLGRSMAGERIGVEPEHADDADDAEPHADFEPDRSPRATPGSAESGQMERADHGGGCHAAPGGSPAPIALFLLTLLALRRRR